MSKYIIIGIIISACLFIWFDLKNNKSFKYLFKPLTTILIIGLATIQEPGDYNQYKFLIISGLIFSLVGDIFLMLPSDKFVQGLSSFFIAHVLYIIAFSSGNGPYYELILVLPALVYSSIFLWILLPKTGKLTIPVILYSAVLLVFLWQATGRFYYLTNTSATYVLLGAILFVISDSILGYSKFINKGRLSSLLIHSTYWGAQLLLALSI